MCCVKRQDIKNVERGLWVRIMTLCISRGQNLLLSDLIENIIEFCVCHAFCPLFLFIPILYEDDLFQLIRVHIGRLCSFWHFIHIHKCSIYHAICIKDLFNLQSQRKIATFAFRITQKWSQTFSGKFSIWKSFSFLYWNLP